MAAHVLAVTRTEALEPVIHVMFLVLETRIEHVEVFQRTSSSTPDLVRLAIKICHVITTS
jgi:hypothetical protein